MVIMRFIEGNNVIIDGNKKVIGKQKHTKKTNLCNSHLRDIQQRTKEEKAFFTISKCCS